MLEAHAEARPEAASRYEFPVIRPGIVVGADRGAGRHVRLAHHQGRAKKRVVVMLFMEGIDQRIQYFTATDGRVVTQIGVDQSRAIFQLGMGCHNETYRLHAIEYPTAISDDPVHELTAFSDLRHGFGRTVDRDIFYLIGSFQIGITADAHILDDLAVFDDGSVSNHSVITTLPVGGPLRECLKCRHQSGVIPVFRPKECITWQHPIKRKNAPASILIADLHPDAHML